MTYERAFVDGTLDTFDFVLAEALGMTVTEVGRMPHLEFIAWRAFYVYRSAMMELETAK